MSLNTLSLDKEEREIYEARLQWLRDENAVLQKAHEEGVEKSKLEIAKEMLAAGSDLAFIAKMTHLPLEKIRQLQKKQGMIIYSLFIQSWYYLTPFYRAHF